DAARVLHSLADLGFALDHPSLAQTEVLFAGLEEFRQHLGGELTLTMLRGVGEPIDVNEVDRDEMLAAIDDGQAFAKEHCRDPHKEEEAVTAVPSHDETHCK